MRSQAAPVTEIADVATEISLMGMKIFPSLMPGTKVFFDKIASPWQHSGKSGIIFAWHVQ